MSLAQALNSLPRRRLLDGVTPIRRLHGIENALGSSSNRVQIYAKRDDLMSLGGGGNKLRKLEFLLGDAAAGGADTIIATGGRQSNFARLAAAAAAKLGLACELVLSRMVPRVGPLDGLVNCAAIVIHADPLETAWTDWERIFRINLFGAYETSRPVARSMIESGARGAIVSVASEAGKKVVVQTL
jgi:1-aminocyclopropane-1-carboxylate deaminase/D-cysteine desulfhydrase-like pyridoxal-dependent ACC family enzyme